MIYVVGVLHSTGHGDNIGIALVTSDPAAAIKTAFDIEKLGYKFNSETGVVVYRLAQDRQYPKNLFKFSGDAPPADFPIVLSRSQYSGMWKDEWFDPQLQQFAPLVSA